MFSIKKEHLRKALALVSKAVAQRQQEEVIYRSVRVSTFKDGDENYVAFQTMATKEDRPEGISAGVAVYYR